MSEKYARPPLNALHLFKLEALTTDAAAALVVCMGHRGELYLQVADRVRWKYATPRVPVSVLDLRRLAIPRDQDWNADGIRVAIAGDQAFLSVEGRPIGTIPAAELRKAVGDFLGSSRVQAHAGLFRVDVELRGVLDLAIVLDLAGVITVRLVSITDTVHLSEFAGSSGPVTIAELENVVNLGANLRAEPMLVYRTEIAGQIGIVVHLGKHHKGNGPFERWEQGIRTFLASPIVKQCAQ